MLKAEQRRVSEARRDVALALDEIEKRLAPNNLARVAWWWAKRSARKNPVLWSIGGVSALALVAGLISWAALDDRED